MAKSTHPLMHLMVMIGLMLVMLLVSVILTAVFTLAGFDLLSGTGLLWTQAVTQLLTFIVPVVVMTSIYYKGYTKEYYRLDFSSKKWLVALAGVVALLLITPLNEFLTTWNDSWDFGAFGDYLRSVQDQTEGILDDILKTDTVGGLLANLLVVALIPAVSEEIFFRAGIQNLLHRWFGGERRRWAGHVAILLTAVIFSLGHGEVFSFMPRFVLGLMLGYLFFYGGSILPNMLMHFTNNAIVVILYWLVARGVLDIDPEEPVVFGLVLTVCCTVAAIGVMWVTLSGKKTKKQLPVDPYQP